MRYALIIKKFISYVWISISRQGLFLMFGWANLMTSLFTFQMWVAVRMNMLELKVVKIRTGP